MVDETRRELTGRLLAAQQQVIDLRARLDREHQAGEGFRRFSERALELDSVEAFWNLASEEVLSTFGTENALLVRVEHDSLALCATCCVPGMTDEHLRVLAPTVLRALSSRRVVLVGEPLPELVDTPTAVLLIAGFRDRDDGGHTYAFIASVSSSKAPFYPTFDEAIGPLYSAFVNHAGALQQHLRGRIEARRVARQLKRLADVAARTSNAVVIADRDARIEWVNDGFVRLTGFTLDEVIGKRPGTFLQGPGTDEGTRRKMREAIARFEPFDCEICNYAKSGRQYYVQIESRVTYDDNGEPNGFIAIESDVTERRIAAQRDGLAERIAALLLRSSSIEEAGRRLVRELVVELDVPVAQVWSVVAGQPTLQHLAGASSVASGTSGEALLALTRQLEFRAGQRAVQGVGQPGLAWGTGRVVFVRDIAHPPDVTAASRRLHDAAQAGVVALCDVPIRGPTGILGVIEVGSARGHPINDLLPSILERVAEQFASFILHDRSRRAFQTIFDQSPDGLLLVDATGHIEAANERAHRLFGDTARRFVNDLIVDAAALVQAALARGAAPAAPIAVSSDAATGADASSGFELFHRDATTSVGASFSAEISVAATSTATGPGAILAVRDLTERHRMEAALTQSLREKETLLKEIHHRVKNNLQIISSLLMLQVDQMPSTRARELLEESVHRVRSMALIHQHLYGALSLERIDLAAYARQLSESLRGALAPSSRLRIDAESIEVTVEHAVPMGLILNELMTNALKYGARNSPVDADANDDIVVELHRDDANLTLEVRDHGPGLPAGFDVTQTTSLGLQLVRSLTRQLRARLVVNNEGGACFRIVAPLSLPRTSTSAGPMPGVSSTMPR